jgi:hypothetical protein
MTKTAATQAKEKAALEPAADLSANGVEEISAGCVHCLLTYSRCTLKPKISTGISLAAIFAITICSSTSTPSRFLL